MADRADLFARFIAWGSHEGHEDRTKGTKGCGCITSWCARVGVGAGAGINKSVKHISRMTARMRRIAPRACNPPRAPSGLARFFVGVRSGAVRLAGHTDHTLAMVLSNIEIAGLDQRPLAPHGTIRLIRSIRLIRVTPCR